MRGSWEEGPELILQPLGGTQAAVKTKSCQAQQRDLRGDGGLNPCRKGERDTEADGQGLAPRSM